MDLTGNIRPRGLTVRELAAMAGVDRETMARALEHHGYLEVVPYRAPLRRRLVTRQAEEAGLGRNILADRFRIGRRDGDHRASAFPVFEVDQAPAILWTVDLDGIRRAAATLENKRARLQWMLAHHSYFPNAFIAKLVGCTVRAVEKGRARSVRESSVVSYNTDRGVSCDGKPRDHHRQDAAGAL